MFEENTRKGGRPSRRPDRETLLHLGDLLSAQKIAQLYHVNVATVYNWQKHYDIPPRHGRPTKRPTRRKLNNLCKKYSHAEIAKQIGVPVGTVSSWVWFYKHHPDKVR
jgi:hypothetical protein